MKRPCRATKPLLALLLTCLFYTTTPANKAQADAMDPFTGEVQCGGYNFCPMEWLPCEGQTLQIFDYEALFSLLGTTYGGDGMSTFNLPDLRGRVMMHQGQGTGLTNRTLGTKGGSESHLTSQAELPAHTHNVYALSGPGDSASPSSNSLWANSSAAIPHYSTKPPISQMSPSAIATNNGSTQPYNIMKPYQVNRCCIAVYGIYPTRP